MNTSISSTTTNSLPQAACLYHAPAPITHFCSNEQCLMPLCGQCIPIHQQEHGEGQGGWNFDPIEAVQKKQLKNLMSQMESFHNLEKRLEQNQFHDYRHIIQSQKQEVLTTVNNYFEELERKYAKFNFEIVQNEIQENINEIQKFYRKLQKKEYIKFLIISKQTEKDKNQLIQKFDKQIQKSQKLNSLSIDKDLTQKIQQVLENNIQTSQQDSQNDQSQHLQQDSTPKSQDYTQYSQNTMKQQVHMQHQQPQQNYVQYIQQTQAGQTNLVNLSQPTQVPIVQAQSVQKPPMKRSFNQAQTTHNPVVYVHQGPPTPNYQQLSSNNQQNISQNTTQNITQTIPYNIQQNVPLHNPVNLMQIPQYNIQNQPVQMVSQQNQFQTQQSTLNQVYQTQNPIQTTVPMYQQTQLSNLQAPQQTTYEYQPSNKYESLQQGGAVQEKIAQNGIQSLNIPSYQSPFANISPVKRDPNVNIQSQLELNTSLISKAKGILKKQNTGYTNQPSFDMDLQSTFKQIHQTQPQQIPQEKGGFALDNMIQQQHEIQERLWKIKLDQDYQF